MRVLFYGNNGNIGFRITQWLRSKGIDAHLFISRKENNPRSFPEWENPELKENYPEWMHLYDTPRFMPTKLFFDNIKDFAKGLVFIFSLHRLKRFKPRKSLRKKADSYDIILTTGTHIVEILYVDKPVIFLPIGRDMTQVPFQSESFQKELFSYLYRQRIGRVEKIITCQEDIIWAAKLLKVGNKISRLPGLFVDVHEIEKQTDREFFATIKQKYDRYDYVFLNTTRKNLDPNRVDYKGNDKLLYAYKKFIENQPEKKVIMLSGVHGHDVESYKNLVQKLNLEEHIEYLEHLSLPYLHAYFSLPNAIVFDQFTYNKNNLNGTQREALAFGKITVSSTDISSEIFQKAYGPGCPLMTASSAEEIFQAMLELSSLNKKELEKKAAEVRQWTFRYLHWESRIDELIAVLKETKDRFKK